MIKIRKYKFPKITVTYKGNVLVGKITNEIELIRFRYDIIGDPEYGEYEFTTELDEAFKMDKYGIYYPVIQSESDYSDVLRSIIEKQMGLRIKDSK